MPQQLYSISKIISISTGQPPGIETAPNALARTDAILQAEQFGHQLAGAVNYLWVLSKLRRAIDETKCLDQPPHTIERTQVVTERGEYRQADEARGRLAGIEIQFGAQAAGDKRAIGTQRTVAGEINQIPDLDQRLIYALRLGKRRQLEVKFVEPHFVRSGGHRFVINESCGGTCRIDFA